MLVCVFIGMSINGCVAVWGDSYKVKEKNENEIIFQYDSGINSSGMMQKMASEHCQRFGKEAEIVDAGMPGILLGIIEEKYACIEKLK